MYFLSFAQQLRDMSTMALGCFKQNRHTFMTEVVIVIKWQSDND
jgi:hypothetical protein